MFGSSTYVADDRQMSSDVLVNLSLAGDCTMTYVEEKGRGGGGGGGGSGGGGGNAAAAAAAAGVSQRKTVDVFLPRRSLQVQSGGASLNTDSSSSLVTSVDPSCLESTYVFNT